MQLRLNDMRSSLQVNSSVLVTMLLLLMQEYVYKFNYDQEDGISMDIARNGKTVDRTKKRQVCAFTDMYAN